MFKTKKQKGLFTILVGVVLWFLPMVTGLPNGLTMDAWHMFAIFVATIVGYILTPMPIGAIALIAVGLTGFLKVLKPAAASNTARGGGIVFPILRSLCSAFQSEPEEGTQKKIGSYLIASTFQANCITSSIFITAVAPNLLVVSLASETAGVSIGWGQWALAMIVPGLLALLICPLLVYKIFPPEMKATPDAPKIAAEKLQEMGSMKGNEKVVLFAFILALALWATSSFTGINATMTALVCVGVMLIGGAIEWEDVITEKGAWNTLVWMGGLMSLATGLNKSGFIKWFADGVGSNLDGVSWVTALLVLALVNMYLHYAFASMSAHVGAVYAAFLTVAIAAGAPPLLAALMLGCETGIMGGLTHYATGSAPIFFGANYITQAEWWKVGFIVSISNMICFVGIGMLWWKVIGLW